MADEHLTNGWEPDLDPGDSLLRRFVLANADRNAFMADRAGGRHRRWDDVAVADPGSPVLFDNAAVVLQPPAYVDVPDLVRRVVEFYPPERHFVLLSAWPTADLGQAGLQLMGHPPLMFRPAGGRAPASPDGLRIVRVTDAETLGHFIDTLIEGYPVPGVAGSALATTAVLDGPVRLFVGYVDGRPVATAGARLGHGIVDVEWVATLPGYRGRGIGAALTWAATLVSPAEPATLIASDAGQPVYEKMGYLRIMRVTMWHRPPAV
jgi:ribosomal protein S18 acetylase RimI-like enzyme